MVAVVIEQPKQASFGELALPVAFSLAKARKKAPRAIAEEIAANLPAIPGIASVEVAGGGYLNVRLDRGAYAMGLLAVLVPAIMVSFDAREIWKLVDWETGKEASTQAVDQASLAGGGR